MNTSEVEKIPLAALETAEQEFSVGEHRAGCYSLWKATEATFALLAKAHGLDATDLHAVAKVLDAKLNLPNRRHYYLGGLISGRLANDHACMDVLEDYDIEGLRRTIPRFLREYLDGLDYDAVPLFAGPGEERNGIGTGLSATGTTPICCWKSMAREIRLPR